MRGCWAAVCLLLMSMQAYAGFSHSEPAGEALFKQRTLYLEAIQDIENGDVAMARRIATRLTDYPLYPYIEYTALIYNLRHEPASKVLAFRTRYKALPIAHQLMENWVYVLARQEKWAEFLQYYHPATFTGKRNACYYAYALYRQGHKQAAFAAARKLWLVNYSQPQACDPIFRIWRDSGQFDARVAWQRYVISMQSGEISLANYLKRFLSRSDRRLANQFSRVRRDPRIIERSRRFRRNDTRTNQLILYGIDRLAWREPAAAFKALQQYAEHHDFTRRQMDASYTQIGIRLSVHGDKHHLLNALPLNLRDDPPLAKARIRLALRQLAWPRALALISLLPASEQASARWRFWKARALMHADDDTDRNTARQIFDQLAQDRGYYSFMAADLIGAKYHYDASSVHVGSDEIDQLAQRPGMRRAFELFTLNERNRARREWDYAIRGFDAHQLIVAAHLAARWGWYRQGINAMVAAHAFDNLAIRFPLAYLGTFASSARTWDIPLQWSLAVARQESAFMPDARSTAGAIGIMQILPGTARLTARRQGLNYDGWRQLNQPIANIRLGSAYLGSLLRQFNNNRVIASAAYNAGPARVAAWVNPALPLDVWIETLPFPQTRNYVENVLMFAAIYSHRLSEPQPIIYRHELSDFLDQEVTFNSPAAPQGREAGAD